MDLIDQLTAEHREAEDILRRLKDTDPGPERRRLVERLASALHTHMAVEERFVYPIVVDVLGREPEEEADTEHDLVREGLSRLDELVSEPGFGAAVDMIEAGISHHVEDEEDEIFPRLRQEAGARIEELDPAQCEAAVKNAIDHTRDELYREAQDAEVAGRSTMSKDELAAALARQ